MTLPMREQLKDADLAWATADALMASAMDQLQWARESLAAGPTDLHGSPRDGRVVDPAVLRARGAL